MLSVSIVCKKAYRGSATPSKIYFNGLLPLVLINSARGRFSRYPVPQEN